MTASADLPLVLFVVEDDPTLEARLRRLRPESGRAGRRFRLLVSRAFDPRLDAVLFIVPAAAVNTILGGRDRLQMPVLAYGSEQGLAPAFLRGCVDYLREPWTLTELQLRVQRWLERRGEARAPGAGIRLDGTTLHGPAGAVELSVVEARLFDMLLSNAGRVTSREALFYRLWGRLPTERSRVIDVHVAALRRKCRIASGDVAGGGADAPCVTITAVRREGYLLAVARPATRTASPADC